MVLSWPENLPAIAPEKPTCSGGALRVRSARRPRSGRDAGFDQHLVKPVSIDTLLRTVSAAPIAALPRRPAVGRAVRGNAGAALVIIHGRNGRCLDQQHQSPKARRANVSPGRAISDAGPERHEERPQWCTAYERSFGEREKNELVTSRIDVMVQTQDFDACNSLDDLVRRRAGSCR